MGGLSEPEPQAWGPRLGTEELTTCVPPPIAPPVRCVVGILVGIVSCGSNEAKRELLRERLRAVGAHNIGVYLNGLRVTTILYIKRNNDDPVWMQTEKFFHWRGVCSTIGRKDQSN